ncbi:MAG: DUF4491 family protein [Clostridia bacterium]|nr:DUF4491 family protein [Clostridia bacterium]
MNFTGLIIALISFLCIGLFHPIVIKFEYYFGCQKWPVFAILGVAFTVASLFLQNAIVSSVLGVIGCSCFWTIKELFDQRERVRKGWFPKNPNKKD